MDISPDNDIEWDKLDAHLNLSALHGSSLPEVPLPALTEEEQHMLGIMKRIRAQFRTEGEEKRFSAQEGWEVFKRKAEAEDGATWETSLGGPPAAEKRIFLKPWGYAVAASVLLALGTTFWFLSRSGMDNQQGKEHMTASARAVLPPARGVQLVLGNGKTVDITHQRLRLKGGNGSQIMATDSIISYLGHRVFASSEPVAYNTLLVPRGNKTQVTLSDGTRVWMNADSRLTYPAVFEGPSREVVLEGEAYFEVAPDQHSPFIVHAKSMDIQVLGTSFDLNTYHPQLEATLTSGRIQVKAEGRQEILKPGEQARTGNGTMLVERVNTEGVTAWKDAQIFMEDASLEQIAEVLGRTYDYTFVLDDPTLAKLHFTLDIKAPQTLQGVLDHLCKTTEGLSFVVKGREVRITR